MNYGENILSIEDLRKRRFAKKILNAGQKIYLTVLEETFQNRKIFNRKDPLDILMITDSMFNAGRSKNIRRYIEVFFNFLQKLNQEKHPRFSSYKEKDIEKLTETRLREIISLMRDKNEREIEKMTHYFHEKKRRLIHSLNEE
jgi:hypothetical protein